MPTRRWIGNHLIALAWRTAPELLAEHKAYIQQMVSDQAQAETDARLAQAITDTTMRVLMNQQMVGQIAARQ
jgi:hypothetical protein